MGERPYRVLVTGSRDWTDYNAVIAELRALLRRTTSMATPPSGYVLVHGAARGLDTIAARAAIEISATLGILFVVEPHPAEDFGPWPACGPIRNAYMVSLGADICLAFPGSNSRGTWDCVRKANAAGIRVIIVPPRPNQPKEST